jgi:glycosyltransferase involved in cell wall biosynthesis
VHYPGPSAITLDRNVRGCGRAISLIVSFHGADLSALQRAPGNVIAMWRRLLSRVDAVVVCSNDLGRKVIEVFGDAVVPRVIHNGLDALAFVAMASASTPLAGRNILNVAKFEEKKGQDVLIRAFALIADDYGDVDLVLIGASDKALPALKELCANEGMEKRVRFLPDTPHEKVADYYRLATIFALPSRQEPFGIVLLEAGAFGLPVVASSVGGIPEILTDGLTGRLVAPDDPAELARCLRMVLDSPESARDMGARLRHHVLSNFTWTSAHDKYVALATGGRSNDEVRGATCNGG